ncbi:peptidylprolyl isomerase [Hydrogenophaga sp. NH-16]|uniref:peptidylprolyl isomerase n=1 Tax=Hydrogenophaga sp. NH-16 TaxID=2184519 RepID=UPI001F4DCAA9|nr:peptidylprolyl isomerase [Hydrogenophaga sp. NH-16]
MSDSTSQGCGSAHCACSGQMQIVPASINGIALHEPGEALDAETLRERAYTELLRQRAVHKGLLPRFSGLVAPTLNEAERHVIEAMTDDEVVSPDPTDDECQRYYEANKNHFIVGQALHVRHILFAVTPGVNVHALTQRAEAALLELIRKDVPPGRFEQLAAELSNCPSSAEGGDLGWVTPEDCAPELANELFFQSDSRWGMGVHPRLVHTRFGLHIIEVLGRKKGTLPAYEEVADAIRQRLQHQSRATALRQYMRLLVGQAKVEGIELEGADSPLVQ